jgi:hypothetical protein
MVSLRWNQELIGKLGLMGNSSQHLEVPLSGRPKKKHTQTLGWILGYQGFPISQERGLLFILVCQQVSLHLYLLGYQDLTLEGQA